MNTTKAQQFEEKKGKVRGYEPRPAGSDDDLGHNENRLWLVRHQFTRFRYSAAGVPQNALTVLAAGKNGRDAERAQHEAALLAFRTAAWVARERATFLARVATLAQNDEKLARQTESYVQERRRLAAASRGSGKFAAVAGLPSPRQLADAFGRRRVAVCGAAADPAADVAKAAALRATAKAIGEREGVSAEVGQQQQPRLEKVLGMFDAELRKLHTGMFNAHAGHEGWREPMKVARTQETEQKYGRTSRSVGENDPIREEVCRLLPGIDDGAKYHVKEETIEKDGQTVLLHRKKTLVIDFPKLCSNAEFTDAGGNKVKVYNDDLRRAVSLALKLAQPAPVTNTQPEPTTPQDGAAPAAATAADKKDKTFSSDEIAAQEAGGALVLQVLKRHLAPVDPTGGHESTIEDLFANPVSHARFKLTGAEHVYGALFSLDPENEEARRAFLRETQEHRHDQLQKLEADLRANKEARLTGAGALAGLLPLAYEVTGGRALLLPIATEPWGWTRPGAHGGQWAALGAASHVRARRRYLTLKNNSGAQADAAADNLYPEVGRIYARARFLDTISAEEIEDTARWGTDAHNNAVRPPTRVTKAAMDLFVKHEQQKGMPPLIIFNIIKVT